MANDGVRISRSQLSLPQSFIAPRDALEEALAEIWCLALNVDCVGAEDEFIDLGGDSFHAEVIAMMVEEKFGIHVPLSALVRAPTIAALAHELGQLGVGEKQPAASE